MRSACLPWYDLEEIRWATDALWSALAHSFRRDGIDDVPATLDRATPLEELWSDERFLFGQACGYDALLAHPERIQLVATPCYDAAGCEGADYISLVVVRDEHPARTLSDLRGLRFTFNNPTSHSGMNSLRALVAAHAGASPFFGAVLESGAHVQSVELLLAGKADVAAIDCITFTLLSIHRPALTARLRTICRTASVAAPPYVTSRRTPAGVVAIMRRALAEAMIAPELAAARRALTLTGIKEIPLCDYQPIAHLERAAIDLGYSEIAPAMGAPAHYLPTRHPRN